MDDESWCYDMREAPRQEGAKYLIWDGVDVVSVEYQSDDWVQISDSGRATSFRPLAWRALPSPPKRFTRAGRARGVEMRQIA